MNMKKCVVTNPKTGETKAFTTNREVKYCFELSTVLNSLKVLF
jgi:hypothetical protein